MQSRFIYKNASEEAGSFGCDVLQENKKKSKRVYKNLYEKSATKFLINLRKEEKL